MDHPSYSLLFLFQYDAKEFVSTASMPFKEPTPIVSANSEAAEVILTKKDRDSPVKSRKQGSREPKADLEQIVEKNLKPPSSEHAARDLECNKIYSIGRTWSVCVAAIG